MVFDFSTFGLFSQSACIGSTVGAVGVEDVGGWKLRILEMTLKEHLVFEFKSMSNSIRPKQWEDKSLLSSDLTLKGLAKKKAGAGLGIWLHWS